MNERDRRFRQFRPHGPRSRLLPPLGVLDAAMKGFNFGVATPMDAVSEPLPRKTSRNRPRKPMNVDVVAATVALRAALPAGLLDTFGHGPATTLVVQVPAASWCVPIKEAFFDLISKVRDLGGPAGQNIWKFVWEGNQRSERPTAGNDDVAKALGISNSIIGISPNPKRILPRTLTAAPDFYVVVPPLNGEQVREVITIVTGRKVHRPTKSPQAIARRTRRRDRSRRPRGRHQAGVEAVGMRGAAPEVCRGAGRTHRRQHSASRSPERLR